MLSLLYREEDILRLFICWCFSQSLFNLRLHLLCGNVYRVGSAMVWRSRVAMGYTYATPTSEKYCSAVFE